MDYDKIKYTVYSIYQQCNINQLPFHCIDLLHIKGFKCIKYTELSESKRNACIELSPDACTIGNTIYYNSRKSERRIRFSLMHELGHIELKTNNETEANLFASNILCPSIALHYAGLMNIREIANLFNISLECAKYARECYQKWYYSAKKYGLTDVDRKLYEHFYDYNMNRFVFKQTQCIYCDALIYNSNKPICEKCDKPLSDKSLFDTPTTDFLIAENIWLYHDL